MLRYRLKNDNEERHQIWRYHHYKSELNYTIKRSSLLASLRKVAKMASDPGQLLVSATCKLNEFASLQYPKGIRRYMCAIMARDTGDLTWRKIRQQQLD